MLRMPRGAWAAGVTVELTAHGADSAGCSDRLLELAVPFWESRPPSYRFE